MNGMGLGQIIDLIKNNEILIPDFQRKFVWSDTSMQKKLVASVLSGLPIGSFLFLKGESDEFVSKKVGSKRILTFEDTKLRKFLLDGQQRMTVLTNVFSNVLFDSVQDWSELASDSLKVRYFLSFEKTNPDSFDSDIFGIRNFCFPFKPDTEEPVFLTDKMLDYIDVISVMECRNDNPFHPAFNLNSPGNLSKLINACRNDEGFMIPLFILTDAGDSKLRRIVNTLAHDREEYLMETYSNSFTNHVDRIKYFNELFSNVDNQSDFRIITEADLMSEPNFGEYLSAISDEWNSRLCKYLLKCVNDLKVNIIEVEKSQRARAIDIYENLNRGGISLDTFDLIIAKAAKIIHTGFYEEFIKVLDERIIYPDFYKISQSGLVWICKDQLNVYSEGKNQVTSTYLKVFQNLLSLVCAIPIEQRNIPEKLNINLIKRDKILGLSSEEIVDNYRNVMLALNRALCFLQSNCGIRNLDDISYEHLLLGLSYFMFDNTVFGDVKKTKILEYWYWSSIFSGDYDSDQTTRIINDLKKLSELFYCNGDVQYFIDRKNHIFDKKFFSDKDTLLMMNVQYEKLPKDIIRKSICQFILSNRPIDFLENTRLTTWDTDLEIDAHHIVPIKGSLSIKDSRDKLRQNKKHLLNSPLNFTYILSKSNRLISNLSIEDYFRHLENPVFSDHFLPIDRNILNEDHAYVWLEQRFNSISGAIKSSLDKLMLDWK